ncbi:MAG: hypothetical protein ACK55Z_08185, partial [bacterium]
FQKAVNSASALPSKLVSLAHQYTTKPILSLLQRAWDTKEAFINALPFKVKVLARTVEVSSTLLIFAYFAWPIVRWLARMIYDWINPVGNLHNVLGTVDAETLLRTTIENAGVPVTDSASALETLNRMVDT